MDYLPIIGSLEYGYCLNDTVPLRFSFKLMGKNTIVLTQTNDVHIENTRVVYDCSRSFS